MSSRSNKSYEKGQEIQDVLPDFFCHMCICRPLKRRPAAVAFSGITILFADICQSHVDLDVSLRLAKLGPLVLLQAKGNGRRVGDLDLVAMSRYAIRRKNPSGETLEHLLKQIRIHLFVLTTDLGCRDRRESKLLLKCLTEHIVCDMPQFFSALQLRVQEQL